MRRLALCLAAFVALSCRSAFPPPPALSPEARADREAKLAAAREEVAARPDDLDARIWLGRRQAYVGLYREAIATFSEGLDLATARGDAAFEARFLRHRGHRFVTVREFDAAIADLERAAALLARVPDEVEPDGLPNARNVPTGTLHGNVTYHLGLALFLAGRFEEAAAAYDACVATSRNPDMLCAASYWRYLALRRLSRDAEAARVLEPIRADMDVIENRAYHGLLLAYRGERSLDALLAEARAGGEGVDFATVGFGAGHARLVAGDAEAARAIFREVVSKAEPAAFGFIASETELDRNGV